MTTCDECGVTSRGAFIQEFEDGRDLCEDCWPADGCERCGTETTETTLSGEYRCRRCQETIRGQDSTRPADQAGLGEWSR